MSEHVLCYVSGPWAYFTSKPLDKQWGDDWNDAPYEHNAGTPYSDAADQIVRVAWDGPLVEPNDMMTNSPWSVEEINRGAVAWLRTSKWHSGIHVNIMAGATVAEFCAKVIESGGEIYLRKEPADA